MGETTPRITPTAGSTRRRPRNPQTRALTIVLAAIRSIPPGPSLDPVALRLLPSDAPRDPRARMA
jgi:hypothetical protein